MWKNDVAVTLGPSFIFLLVCGVIKILRFNLITIIGYSTMKLIILCYCILSIVNMGIYAFEQIAASTVKKICPKNSILKIGLVALGTILLFSIIFTTVYSYFPGSFKGDFGTNLFAQFMSFIYFSIITFLTVGYGDIIPLTNFSRLLVCIEVIFGFILIIYGISSFSLMYQSYKVNSPFEVTQVKDGDDDENGSPDSCKMNSHLKSN